METSLSKPVQPIKSRITIWLSSENSLLTAFMEGVIVTNGKMLSIGHGIVAGYWLLRSLPLGYPATGICLLWFIFALLIYLKQK